MGTKKKNDLSFLSSVELAVFDKSMNNYKEHGEFLRDDAITLAWTFGSLIYQVFELIDEEGTVNILMSPTSGKLIVQVYGKGGDVYYVPPLHGICQCIGFQRRKKPYCKHVLAAHIALALYEKEEYEEISETEIVQLFNKFVFKK